MPVHHDHSLIELINSIFSTPSEKAGAIVATGMISSPMWLQSIQPISQAASIFAPILGCIYLSLQIGFKLWDRFKDED